MTAPLILNIGCGTRTSPHCTNIDWSPMLRLRASRLGRYLAPLVLSGERLAGFEAMSGNVIVHDIRRGIPAEDGSADAVYHSHVLEHLDRAMVPSFFSEIRRVLKEGGVHRIVVPDFELACRKYVDHCSHCSASGECSSGHEEYIESIIEQMVRHEAFGTSQQGLVRRKLENLVLGDARKRGETHRWMYDRITLTGVLERAGFTRVTVVDEATSSIVGWDALDLDRQPNGEVYKPGSIYVEATR